jgi:RimJ/RimL family protein N-acetyltransferase
MKRISWLDASRAAGEACATMRSGHASKIRTVPRRLRRSSPGVQRVRLAWSVAERSFEAIEPDPNLVLEHAAKLVGWYNAPANASMMESSGMMSHADVVDFWRELRRSGGRGFLGFMSGELVGDADVRGVRDGAAEFAIMIGASAQQGRGLGRALASMVHVFAFRELGLERLFVPPRRDNRRVHALNRFLGYERDNSAAARVYADGPDSETYSISASTFRALHPDAWERVVSEVIAGAGPR